MRKRTRIITLASLITLLSVALLPASAQLTAGARAGANLATEPAEGLYHEFLARPYVGVFAQYQLSTSVDFQFGLNFSGEGANYKDLSSSETYHIRHSFLTIPVMAQYRFPFGGYIEAGPQFGFLLSATEKYNDEESIDSKKYYKGTDVSAGIGLGYEIPKGSLTGFGISVRYMRGLTNLNKIDVGANENIKSRVLSIGLTYRRGRSRTTPLR